MAGLLLLLHVLLAWRAAVANSMTVDEAFHIAGGYLFDKYNDFRLHPENGVLPQRLHALPAVLSGAHPPPLTPDNPFWRLPALFGMSRQFVYDSGNDPWQLLLGARAMNLIFSTGVCALVFFWARRFAGDIAGLTALTMAAFSPTLLAHGPLATSDMAATLFLLASSGCFWWQLRHPTWRTTLASAIVFGLACISKYSAVLLLPVFALLILVHVLQPGEHPPRAKPIFIGLAAHGVGGWLIIWACFGFRYQAFAPDLPPTLQFGVPWELILSWAGWQGKVIQQLREIHFLPEGFLYGYLYTYATSLTRAAFLAGEYSDTGWRSFFPLAFLWKSTPVELAGTVLCLVFASLRWSLLRAGLARFAPLLVLAFVYGGVALLSHLNIGHRHLLPLYPILFILTGVVVASLGRVASSAAVVGGCLQLASALSILPQPLTYFNAMAGGPSNGWRMLVDSSLDWGQGLKALHDWLGQHNPGPNPQPVFLSYFGSAIPERYGIDATLFASTSDFRSVSQIYDLKPGLYCFGATMFQEVYNPSKGPWREKQETEYRSLRNIEPDIRAFLGSPVDRERVLKFLPAEAWEKIALRYHWLRHARLTAYLRVRGLDALAGYSILIFNVSEQELTIALEAPVNEWPAAIETMRLKRGR